MVSYLIENLKWTADQLGRKNQQRPTGTAHGRSESEIRSSTKPVHHQNVVIT